MAHDQHDPDFSTPFLLELWKVFDMFDEDSDGGLSCEELEKVFRQLGLEGNNEEEFRQRVANIVSSNDLDGDGKLQWEEFVALMRKNVNVDYRSIFDQFFDHRDNNGKIDCDELKTILSRLGIDVTDQEVKTMMSTADCDGDGHIDFEEFLALLKERDTPYLLTSDQGIVKVLSCHSTDITENSVTVSSSLTLTSSRTTSSHTSSSSASVTSTSSSSCSSSLSSSSTTQPVVRSSSLKALLAQIPQLPQQLGLNKKVSEDANLMRLRTLIHSKEFPTAVKTSLNGRGRPRKIPSGWLHSEGGAEGNTEEAWNKLPREKQTKEQELAKKRLIEKKEALKREKEELKKSKKSVKPSRSADSDGDGSKRRKVIEDAEAVAAAQVAKWEEEDALLDKLLSENNDSDESPEDCEEEVDLLSRVPSLAEESAECELLSKVLKDFSEEDHMLLESMVTKARDIDEAGDFHELSNFTVQSHWDDVEAHRAAAQRWFALMLRAQVMSAVWNSGSHQRRSHSFPPPPPPSIPPPPLISPPGVPETRI